MRIYLARTVRIEEGDQVLDERAFGGRQVRLAFVYLAIERRPVPREELAELLWSGAPPPAWDASLNAIVSKLRGTLRRAGLAADALISASGCYELRFPVGTWIDLDAASTSLHEAEASLRADDARTAWFAANVAFNITERPLLPGEAGEWVERERERLRGIRVRAAECFALSSLLNGEREIGLAMAQRVIDEEPFRETGYQLVMRAHAAAGNRGEALRVYERCRKILAEELGIDPSAETRALHLELLAD